MAVTCGAFLLELLGEMARTALLWCRSPPMMFIALLSENEQEQLATLERLRQCHHDLLLLDEVVETHSAARSYRDSMLWPGHVWCREILEKLNSAAWLEVPDSVREA